MCGSSILLPPGRPQLHIDVLHADEGEGNEGAMMIDTQENVSQQPGTMVIMEQPGITAPELSPSDSLSPSRECSRSAGPTARRPTPRSSACARRSPARHSTAPEQSSPLVQEVAHMFSKEHRAAPTPALARPLLADAAAAAADGARVALRL